ncbi:protein kinase [bacterium]|nr:protein kinase [candidate division CSSED10-310 bacterium]
MGKLLHDPSTVHFRQSVSMKNDMQPKDFLNRRFREYLISDIIGIGGMGTVFKGYHVRLKTIRAIKVLKPRFTEDEQFKARFEREARILAKLENPHLIRIYEFFEEQNYLFLVMEYAAGESLADQMDYREMLPVNKAVEWLSQACTGLAHAHEMGIVHRDLSPDNILITRLKDGSDFVKIIDFGIAKTVFESPNAKTLLASNLTAPGIFLGKIRYCSPEQAAGKELDHRSDQYSIALMLYEAITGIVAFQGETPMESLTMRLHKKPKKLNDIPSGSSHAPKLEFALDKALEQNPDDRYPDIIVFRDAITTALEEDISEDVMESKSSLADDKLYEKPIPLVEEESVKPKKTDTAKQIIPGLTDYFSDASESRIKPRWETPLDFPGKPRRRIRNEKERRTKPRNILGIILLCVIVLFFAGGGVYLYLWGEDPDSVAYAVLNASKDAWNDFSNLIRTWQKTDSQPSKTENQKTVKNIPKSPRQTRKPSQTTLQHKTSNDGPFLASSPGVTPPRVVARTPVRAPEEFPGIGFPAKIIVQAVILHDGSVGQTDIVSSLHPKLDKLAMQSVKDWTFAPGMRYGQPADIIFDVPVIIQKH